MINFFGEDIESASLFAIFLATILSENSDFAEDWVLTVETALVEGAVLRVDDSAAVVTFFVGTFSADLPWTFENDSNVLCIKPDRFF